MKPETVNWRVWIIGGCAGILSFVWLSEIADLPHLILGAPNTPVNWRESLLETVVILIATTISWNLVDRYEKGWLNALEEIHKLAITDGLTNVLNRRECLARAETEFDRSDRFQKPLALAIIDFDNFKSINDKHGHQAGDTILVEFSRVVHSSIRSLDLFGRTGGDEFLLVFIETGHKDATQIIDRIRDQWHKMQRKLLPWDAISATVSVGLSTVQPSDQSLADCIHRADKALYMAKARGRDQVCVL